MYFGVYIYIKMYMKIIVDIQFNSKHFYCAKSSEARKSESVFKKSQSQGMVINN